MRNDARNTVANILAHKLLTRKSTSQGLAGSRSEFLSSHCSTKGSPRGRIRLSALDCVVGVKARERSQRTGNNFTEEKLSVSTMAVMLTEISSPVSPRTPLEFQPEWTCPMRLKFAQVRTDARRPSQWIQRPSKRMKRESSRARDPVERAASSWYFVLDLKPSTV